MPRIRFMCSSLFERLLRNTAIHDVLVGIVNFCDKVDICAFASTCKNAASFIYNAAMIREWLANGTLEISVEPVYDNEREGQPQHSPVVTIHNPIFRKLDKDSLHSILFPMLANQPAHILALHLLKVCSSENDIHYDLLEVLMLAGAQPSIRAIEIVVNRKDTRALSILLPAGAPATAAAITPILFGILGRTMDRDCFRLLVDLAPQDAMTGALQCVCTDAELADVLGRCDVVHFVDFRDLARACSPEHRFDPGLMLQAYDMVAADGVQYITMADAVCSCNPVIIQRALQARVQALRHNHIDNAAVEHALQSGNHAVVEAMMRYTNHHEFVMHIQPTCRAWLQKHYYQHDYVASMLEAVWCLGQNRQYRLGFITEIMSMRFTRKEVMDALYAQMRSHAHYAIRLDSIVETFVKFDILYALKKVYTPDMTDRVMRLAIAHDAVDVAEFMVTRARVPDDFLDLVEQGHSTEVLDVLMDSGVLTAEQQQAAEAWLEPDQDQDD